MPGENRQCPFCAKWFRNKQSIRAHLKGCPNYEPQYRPHVAYQHDCGQIYVSGCDQPPRCCPGCGEDIVDCGREAWERLGETESDVGVVPEGEEIEVV